MPYIVTTSMFPSDKSSEVGKMYVEALTKYPPDDNLTTEVVPGAIKATGQGVKTVGVLDVKEGKLAEAYTRAVNFFVMFHNIEGFEYSIDVHLKIEEALPMIGMSVP